MDPQDRKDSAEVRAILRKGRLDGKAAYARTMARMSPFKSKSDRKYAEHMARAAKFDKEIQATRRLAKLVMRLMAELKQSQQDTDAQLKTFAGLGCAWRMY
jgi:hypothetical protein